MLERNILKCGITPHPLEVEDLRQIYFIITYSCNKACPYCIEPNVHTNKYMDESGFRTGMYVSKNLDMQTLYLHGGEPTLHPDVEKFAYIAKEEGFQVKMFTNGIRMDVLKKLDGIVDEIRFSYEPGLEFMFQEQREWKSRVKLYIMATTISYPTEDALMDTITKALDLGMGCKVRTLNPVNPWAYKNQFVPYLHDRVLKMPKEELICDGNKLAYKLPNGVIVRLGNMQLNPGHLKYSVDPDGVMHTRFTHSDKAKIKMLHEVEAKKMIYSPLLEEIKNL